MDDVQARRMLTDFLLGNCKFVILSVEMRFSSVPESEPFVKCLPIILSIIIFFLLRKHENYNRNIERFLKKMKSRNICNITKYSIMYTIYVRNILYAESQISRCSANNGKVLPSIYANISI